MTLTASVMLTVVVTTAACVVPSVAQTRTGEYGAGRAGAEAETVRIRKLNGLSPRSVVTTPVYGSSVGRSAKPPREWLEVQVIYDTAPAWIDELVIEYFVMSMDRTEGRNTYSLFKTIVRYRDVERDRNHIGVAYLLPSALKRYGRVVAVAVEVSHDGKVVASETDTGITLPPGWWRSPAVVENKDMTVREGYLVEKSKSPFALVNVDDYEVAK
jgi:hypothetical protein